MAFQEASLGHTAKPLSGNLSHRHAVGGQMPELLSIITCAPFESAVYDGRIKGFVAIVLSVWREEKSVGKSKKKAETVFLVCEETGDYNYTLRRKPGGEKLKLSKYSPRLRKHTVHAEKKK
jgi:large subunit ribosomal protein L33